jgi:ATP-dependent protease ClpP protease subunit
MLYTLTLLLALAGGISAEPLPSPKQVCTGNPCVLAVAMTGKIGDDTAAGAADLLDEIEEQKPDAIALLINSGGGSYTSSRIIVDIIKSIKIPVHCYVNEMAASGAFWILQVCTTRTSEPHAILMTHEAYVIFPKDTVFKRKKMLDFAKDLGAMSKIMELDIAKRMGMTLEALAAKLEEGDWMMDPGQAVKAHAIDSISDLDPAQWLTKIKNDLIKRK